MHRIFIAIALLLLPAIAAADPLAERLEKLMNAPRYETAQWGVLIVDQKTGEELYSLNAKKLFVPASTTKLYSVATALDALGADHRFETKVYARGAIKDGVLDGDLILRASGDLTMGGRTTPAGEIEFTSGDHTYASGTSDTVLTKADPLADLKELAKQIAAKGIRQVTGEVLVDDELFVDAESSGSGPTRVSPILINDNCIDVVYEPAKSGEPARVTIRPETKTFEVEQRVETIAASGKLETSARWAGENKLIVTGKIPEGHKPVVRVLEVPSPVKFAQQLFVEALAGAGVATRGVKTGGLPLAKDYDDLTAVATLTSPPFGENARLILKVSHNLHASTLPLLVAAHHHERTLAQGLRREGEFLKKAGVPVDTISFGGGAGGARADHVTPAATVALLKYMTTRDDFAVYERALPIMGVDGTLSKAVDDKSSAKGRVFAKTGTLYWDNGLDGSSLLTSKALAGYLTTKQNRRLIIALYVNNVPLRDGLTTARIGEDLGKLCEVIVEER
jgi:D-alanyl-D-alanine carboxypeptidase/D-alanyl-D-alanine-endopeptidase (penicillin-binding protein 4)